MIWEQSMAGSKPLVGVAAWVPPETINRGDEFELRPFAAGQVAQCEFDVIPSSGGFDGGQVLTIPMSANFKPRPATVTGPSEFVFDPKATPVP